MKYKKNQLTGLLQNQGNKKNQGKSGKSKAVQGKPGIMLGSQ